MLCEKIRKLTRELKIAEKLKIRKIKMMVKKEFKEIKIIVL